jgi:predicted ribosomally synthesized peptide with SipW-like signal peptide
MSRKFNRKAVAAFGVVVLLSAAGAYAYWTQSGSGNGTATTGSGTSVIVNQTSTDTVDLEPGGPGEPLSGDFDNPNSGGVYVTGVTAVVSSIEGAPAGCTTADYRITGTALVGATVPAGTSQGSWSGLSVEMIDRALNQNGCKGAVVNVTYSST